MLPDVSIVYKKYNNDLKPLISEIEGREECFCGPLLHKLAEVFDYISLASLEDSDKSSNLKKADYNLDLCLVISYKCLIGSIKKNLKVFEKKIGKRGLKKLENGHFIGQYKGLKDSIRSNLKIVRKADSVCDLPLLRIIYDDISKMEKMAIKEIPNINASKSESLSFWENMIRWILSIGISLVVGYLVYVFKR